MHIIEQRLKELNIDLPAPGAAVANYVPYRLDDTLLTISGQLPMKAGHVLYQGLVGRDLTMEDGQEAARLCAVNILAQIKAALNGDWDRLKGIIRLGGFVAAPSAFIDHPRVINGASDLMVSVLGELGRHARVAVGVSSLPLNAAVEIDAFVCLKP
jgi:enamine deaminase RidA (YjgF/YER057c/UK114 family)